MANIQQNRPPRADSLIAQLHNILNQQQHILNRTFSDVSHQWVQHVLYNCGNLLREHERRSADLCNKNQKLEAECRAQQARLQSLQVDHDTKQRELWAENQAQSLAIGELALRLLQDWRCKSGSLEQIRRQLEVKGISNHTIQHILNTAGFLDETERVLHPRRSERQKHPPAEDRSV